MSLLAASTTLQGPAGTLETLFEGWNKPFKGIGIVCHPHPLHGGTMHNKVVHTVARALGDMGLATIRFNYRGVGASDGEYDEGRGETEDLLAVIDWVRANHPGYAVWLAGFSFGAYVSLQATGQRQVERLISVAPPVHRFDFDTLVLPDCPWLLIQGDADEVVPFEDVTRWVDSLEKPPRTLYLKGVSHFFHGQLVNLREAIKTLLGPAAAQL